MTKGFLSTGLRRRMEHARPQRVEPRLEPASGARPPGGSGPCPGVGGSVGGVAGMAGARRGLFARLARGMAGYGASGPAQPRHMAVADTLFAPYRPPEGVLGRAAVSAPALAADNGAENGAYGAAARFAAAQFSLGGGMLADGLPFRGYANLAAMMLRAEFRKPVEIIAREATRQWVRLRCVQTRPGHEPPAQTAARLHAIEMEFARLNVRDLVRRLAVHALGYGMGHVWIGLKGPAGTPAAQALPLRLNSHGVGRGQLDRLTLIDPIWTTPNSYNATNPMAEDYYRPADWWVQGTLVHATRLLNMVPYDVPDLLKPAYNFGGLALPQMLEAYVHNFLRTRQSVSDMISNYATRVLRTDMAGSMSEQGGPPELDAQGITARLAAMTAWQNNNGTFVLDRETEDFAVNAAPLSGLADLQAQAQEFMASVPGIPLVKLFGIQPQGLNASSEGEIRVFYDEIAAFQQAHIAPVLRAILTLVQLNLWGSVDSTLDFEFVPLWQMSEQETVAMERQKAEADDANIRAGKITAQEARAREAADAASLYRTLNLGAAPQDGNAVT
ncbi:MAG: DUF1073 domain-containing protein [Acetobacter sp.]|uniref:phage portal protein n=1 Tax=Acetobacter sp. TaxID=440 RepID=UPI0039EB92A2